MDYLPSHKRIEIYNEFSLQYEMGIFLRHHLDESKYKVQFERNVRYFFEHISTKETTKKEIDIAIFDDNKSEKYAIELKFPRNGMVPETMYAFVKDIRFMEELKELGFSQTACVSLVDDSAFYMSSDKYKKGGIYQFFREGVAFTKEPIYKPTGNKEGEDIPYIKLDRVHEAIKWQDLETKNSEPARKFYVITIK